METGLVQFNVGSSLDKLESVKSVYFHEQTSLMFCGAMSLEKRTIVRSTDIWDGLG